LAEAFGHKFTLTDAGYQMHGIVTHVNDKEGHWRASFRPELRADQSRHLGQFAHQQSRASTPRTGRRLVGEIEETCCEAGALHDLID